MNTLQKSFTKVLASAAVIAALSSSAFADSLKLSVNPYSNPSNSGTRGGAYTATVLSGPATSSSYNMNASLGIATATTFQTFCLEPTEFFNAGSTYNYTIAGAAIGGGNEVSSRNIGPGDQLSLGTTWLYSQFAKGVLSASTYATATRQASNLQLQYAFWYLEDDNSSDPGVTPGYSSAWAALSSNVYLTLVANQFGGGVSGLAAAQANAVTGAYGVYALNLTTGSTQNQSQLYYHQVPEGGATIALLGLALIGMAGFRRRFAK
jgi:hypothetical protein